LSSAATAPDKKHASAEKRIRCNGKKPLPAQRARRAFKYVTTSQSAFHFDIDSREKCGAAIYGAIEGGCDRQRWRREESRSTLDLRLSTFDSSCVLAR
jgi:hypothetical protein